MSGSFHSGEWYRIALATPMLRREVSVLRHLYLGRPWYVLADDTSGKVHRLTPAAHAIVGRLDGRNTLDRIWRDVVAQLGTDAPGQDDIVQLMAQLHQADLLAPETRPLLEELAERRDRHRRSKLLRMVMNPLSATLPLLDPDRLLRWLAAVLAPVPRALTWGAAFGLILAGLLLLPSQMAALRDRGLDGLLDLENLLLIALIYPVAKALHELAHGVAIRTRGGPVHEAGLIFVAFYPIPYVEATAAQAFVSKWDRAAVAAAGVVTELCLASVALFVFAAAEPGVVKSLAWNTVLIAGMSTLLVNGNPLMKFDGYWVLTDLIEIPNLATRGAAWWGQVTRRKLLGTHEPDPLPVLSWERVWFALYPPLAFVYRLGVSLSIALFVAGTYRSIGMILAAWSLALMVVWPIAKLAHQGLTDGRIRQAGGRAALGAGLALAASVAALAVPLPYFSVGQGVVWLPYTAQVRADSPGTVAAVHVVNGAQVAVGDPLVTLDAPDLSADFARVSAQVRRIRAERAAAGVADRAALVELSAALRRAEQEQDAAAARVASLTIRAGVAGRVDMPDIGDSLGQRLQQGALLGHILPDAAPLVRAAVRQEEIDLVRSDLRGIGLRLADRMGDTRPAHLVRETPAGRDVLPSAVLALDGGGVFAATEASDGTLHTPERLFLVDLAPDALPDAQPMPYGMRVFVRYEFTPTPLAVRLGRAVRRSFLSLLAA